jgi:hypothetical protein
MTVGATTYVKGTGDNADHELQNAPFYPPEDKMSALGHN